MLYATTILYSMSNTISTSEFARGNTPRRVHRRGMIPKLTRAQRYDGHSSASYYTERFGLAMLPTLVDMIQTRTDKEFLRDKTVTIETLYQKVQQSIAYCMDKLDEGGVLEILRQEILIRKTETGIIVCFAENADAYSKPAALYHGKQAADPFVVRNALSVNWREMVNDFIENMDKKSLRLTDGFALMPSDIAETRALCELMPEGCEVEVKELTQSVIHLTRV